MAICDVILDVAVQFQEQEVCCVASESHHPYHIFGIIITSSPDDQGVAWGGGHVETAEDVGGGRGRVGGRLCIEACAWKTFPLPDAHPSNMFIIPNNPSWWPVINFNRVYSYSVVASCVAVIYDWALTFGQEVELIWARYAAIPYALNSSDSPADRRSLNVDLALNWMNLVMNVLLGIIMVARLHAMYQRSRKMLIFLIVIFLAVTIACAMFTIRDDFTSGVDLIISGTYMCSYMSANGGEETYLITTTVWEVIALFLALWIAVKHFHGLRRSSTGWTRGGWFTVLVQPHAIYAAISCFLLGRLSAEVVKPFSARAQLYVGLIQISSVLQMFVLGPRLVLSIREYHAKTMGNSDIGTDISTISFQAVHTSTFSNA
ncbi:uncharacterized protein EDB91DRAFT_1337037 [Suillus paluster]|uniref:uncharacterized protein n=1 Tax=Suillus paluster TaxID=48578 RepID=UPI001B86FF60|nr:uncharacterized protein EDB91DRAFT_1337037 [Suillus paluster]KAG1738361.1 hypothetical protein EDB91DRAFT_1337037 [Suillus paluster]